jgi:hypothetical protein
MQTILAWQREIYTDTCENVHVLYDGSQKVAFIRNLGKGPKRFEVKIKSNSPWHRRSLKIAKTDCEFVYLNCKR